MSCGCGGFPPSVNLRIEAARIAITGSRDGVTPNQFDFLAERVHAFLTAGLSQDELRNMDHEAQTAGEAVTKRNGFINGPLAAMTMLREGTIDKLESSGILQVGTLVQANEHFLAEASGLTVDELTTLHAELRARGLRLDMTSDQVRQWIKTGVSHVGPKDPRE